MASGQPFDTLLTMSGAAQGEGDDGLEGNSMPSIAPSIRIAFSHPTQDAEENSGLPRSTKCGPGEV